MAFHRLTPEDWKLPDPLSERCAISAPDGSPIEMDGDSWAALFLDVELDPGVPEDIHDLFEVAKGTLAYGWFYYPLYDGGQQQLFRLAEAAAFNRYRELGGSENRPSFHRTIEWLRSRNEIDEASAPLWHAIREQRNSGAHAKHRSVVPPGHASRVLTNVADVVSALYSVGHEQTK